MTDIIGEALLDYQNGNYSEDILTETNISEEDVLPIPYLFRDYSEMSSTETKALELSKGKVLNVTIEDKKQDYDNIGTVTLYLNPKRQEEYYDYIINLNPKRVILDSLNKSQS